jgi:hypothetical protein
MWKQRRTPTDGSGAQKTEKEENEAKNEEPVHHSVPNALASFCSFL